jgi:hypothetical protein
MGAIRHERLAVKPLLMAAKNAKKSFVFWACFEGFGAKSKHKQQLNFSTRPDF